MRATSQKSSRNSVRQCAERNLIDSALRDARKHGVPHYREREYVHRKLKHITVRRYTSNGLGCSMPCARCRTTLEYYGVKVTCIGVNGMEIHREHVRNLPVSPYINRKSTSKYATTL